MKARFLIALLLYITLTMQNSHAQDNFCLAIGCSTATSKNYVNYKYDWNFGFSDYDLFVNGHFGYIGDFTSKVTNVPSKNKLSQFFMPALNDIKAIHLAGTNTSDDLFLFAKKKNSRSFPKYHL